MLVHAQLCPACYCFEAISGKLLKIKQTTFAMQKELKKKEKTKSPNCLPVEQKVAVYFLQELLCFPLCSAVWGNTDVETFHHELK